MTVKGAKQYESALKNKSILYLKKIGCSFVEKRHAGAFRMGKADLTGAIRGLRFEFELKVGSNKLTELQKKWLQKCKDAGCLCAAVWTLNELKWIVENYERYQFWNDGEPSIELPLDEDWRLLMRFRPDS